ncbi:MAG: LuxR family glucitol operon transcriptional activator [Psychroserpens sp.]|jgi:LuxR family glucitol operon transcriptional activator
MSSRTFATRMTCFSLISAVETDVRRVISVMDSVCDLNIPIDVKTNAEDRYQSHFGEKACTETPLGELIEFSDFSDLSKIISKNKKEHSVLILDDAELMVKGLDALVGARNRVCHSRPLEYNDINDLTDFSVQLRGIGDSHWWANINEALENLNNPSFALSLQIPSYWKKTKSPIYNNLPLPEFDDTGFLGRKEERIAVKDLIFSHTRVISLVGEGGVGKTALALRCLYDVLELSESSDSSNFDMLIWVTLKANRLTPAGVVQLRDAIVTSLGLYQTVAGVLGANSAGNIEDILEEIAVYMEEFNILLCIDNLETIDKHNVRKFLAEIPNGSKVLITTRVGLGEIEYRYKLDSLDSKSSIDLIRKLARLLNIEALKKKNNDSLKDLSKRLHNNPLLIKWYVLGLGAGKRREDLLNKQALSYQDALKFCFENLYDGLTEIELEIIQTIECLRNTVSAVELRFILSERGELEIAEALHNLNNSSMLKSEVPTTAQVEGIRKYALTDIASEYLVAVKPIGDEFYSKVRQKNKELKKHLEINLTAHNRYHLDVSSIHASNKDEKICAVYLKQALDLARKEDGATASLELVKKAKSMMPDFSECYRINAILLKGNPHKAEAEYEAAIEYNSESIIAYYSYCQFLFLDDDYEGALTQIDIAIAISPKDEALLSFKALILTRSGDYPVAIDLYEKILPSQKENAHRKFRVSTFQQVISCYIRFTERLIEDADIPEAEVKNTRAVELLEDALNSGNYDDRTFALFRKILINTDRLDGRNKNGFHTGAFIEIIEKYKRDIGFHNKLKLADELRAAIDWMHTDSKDKILLILEEFSVASEVNSVSFHGSIKDVVFKAGNYVSFGFITGDDKLEYFFHRGELHPPEILDDIDSKDLRVAFNASYTTGKGPAAKNVHLT